MKISIITVCYNSEATIRNTIESVLSQSFQDTEYIIVDGGSDDSTLAIVQEYGDQVAKVISEPDRGIYDAMNKGIARAIGDVVGILNADDRYADTAVLRDVLAVFENPRIEACYGDLVYVDAQDRVVRYWRSGECRLWKFHVGWAPPHPTFFVRRNVYERFGIFDMERFHIAGDYELMLRLLRKHRIPVAYVDRVLVRMTLGGISNRSVRNIVKSNWEVYRAWRCSGLPLGYLAPLLKPAQKLFQYVQRPPKETG